MQIENLVGEVLDGKYKIERELGRGGMGAVFFATHLGTERPVAVKVIAPQFMQHAEFVERFRREARAAGRLRHPNVVNVTDFGVCREESACKNVAYLVMEYLDGCTLGEILDEEKQLPLSWTLDILEQVCSAVHEAHQQGIIHRDLKPENIWLEPNQRGGYTVKVLDFGIAKLEETYSDSNPSPPTGIFSYSQPTLADGAQTETIVEQNAATQNRAPSGNPDAARLTNVNLPAQTPGISSDEVNLEARTAILKSETGDKRENLQTLKMNSPSGFTEPAGVDSAASVALTRAGSVLGTPLYMSPEQIRGEKLDARSDIYSLAVISYQMLAGQTPFSGDFASVMQAHLNEIPPPLETGKIPKAVRIAIANALSKNPDSRPQDAETFVNQLRSHSEGVGKLLQRSLVIYTEHLPVFLWVSFLLSIPAIVLTLIHVLIQYLALAGVISNLLAQVSSGFYALITFFVGIWFGSALIGVTTWITAQILAVPLRPVSWRPAFQMVKTKWHAIARTVTTTTIISVIGFVFCLIPGVLLSVRYGLVSPVIMMENLKGKAAIRRSVELAKRSYRTALATMLIYLILPVILSGITAKIISSSVKLDGASSPSSTSTKASGIPIGIGRKAEIVVTDDSKTNAPSGANTGDVEQLIKEAAKEAQDISEKNTPQKIVQVVSETLVELIWLPISIALSSFSSITFALLYLKTRQAGGESMTDLLSQFEESERPRSKWQNRIRERLLQSGRTPSSQ
jgi:serine/threonine protein kinase